MSVHIIPFDQASRELQDAAHGYCRRNLVLPEGEKDWNLGLFAKAWVEVERGKVTGVSAIMNRVDIAVYSCSTARGNARMNQRLHSYLADQGLLGQDVFIQFSSGDPSRMCANWQKEIQRAKAVPANRYMVRVKPI